jgi:uncharacterized membrane protein
VNGIDRVKRTFVAGAIAAVPLAVTGYAIYLVEHHTRTISEHIFGFYVPLFGVVLGLAGVFVLGLVVNHSIGKWLIRRIDTALLKLPVLKQVYVAWKQVTLTEDGSEGIWARVVLVEIEGGGQTLGFTSGRPLKNMPNHLAVYIPSAPLPTTGRICLFPIARCTLLDMSNEEAFKMILSGGNYLPDQLTAAAAALPAQSAGTHRDAAH